MRMTRMTALFFSLLVIGMSFGSIGSLRAQEAVPAVPFENDHASFDRGFVYDGDPAKLHRVPQREPLVRSFAYNPDIVELIEQVDEAMVLNYITGLVSFGPRVTNTPACDEAGDWIYDTFDSMGLETSYHPWSYGSYSGNNIEATLPGQDPTSDEIYIVCGHYDSVTGSPGADDNASGTCAAIACADVMSQYAFNHTVRFVAFSGEEQGLLGSSVYAQEAYQDGDNIVAVLNADMIAFAQDDYDRTHVKVYHDDPSLWIVDYTDGVAQDYYDYINLEVLPSGLSWGSDHASFWDYGFDAVFYHEYNFNDYYHSPQDVIENCDMLYDMRVTRLVLATLAELADLAPLGYIEGYVTDASTGDPVAAEIAVLGGPKSTGSDPLTGFYSLSVMDDSTYTLEATAYGYRQQQQEVYVPPEDTVQVDFALEQADPATLEGVVRSALTGQPLGDVEVTVLGTPLSPEYTNEDGYFSFTIPGAATYQVQAVLPTYIGETQTVMVEENETVTLSFSLGKAESFEDDNGGFQGLMLWEWGVPSSYGPGGAHWGDYCWATNLDGPYGNNANSPLTTTVYDLAEATSASFNFYHYYSTEQGEDGGNVRISTDNGLTWSIISPVDGYPVSSMYWNGEPGYSGESSGWELATFDLDEYLGQEVMFRFRFGSDGTGNGPGWYVDDVFVEASYPVSISLTPDSDTVPRGGSMGFVVDAMNTADYPITLSVWSEVLLPNGSPYPGNPVFGPFMVTLEALSSPSVHLAPPVPMRAPLGTYTYIMMIGAGPETVYARSFFDVTVVP